MHIYTKPLAWSWSTWSLSYRLGECLLFRLQAFGAAQLTHSTSHFYDFGGNLTLSPCRLVPGPLLSCPSPNFPFTFPNSYIDTSLFGVACSGKQKEQNKENRSRKKKSIDISETPAMLRTASSVPGEWREDQENGGKTYGKEHSACL